MPPKGSLRESVLILLHMKQEEIAHAKIRALAQIMVNKEKGPEVFEEYMKAAFPWIQTLKKRNNKEFTDRLQQEVKNLRGLAIKPLWQGPIKSRLKTKLVSASSMPGGSEQSNKLYEKLGMVVPLK